MEAGLQNSRLFEFKPVSVRDKNEVCKSSVINGENGTMCEERQLALLFLDIRNFTTFMETHSPYDVVYVVRKLFTVFNESIKEAGGRIIETAGDSIYAIFGLNQSIKAAVQAAANASYNILHDLEVFNASYAQPYFQMNFDIGIGVNQGKVIVGQYDLEHNERMTAMGLPVNIAARLQSETKELNNNFLMSEAAYQLLDDPKNVKSISVNLRGISNPVEVRLMGWPFITKPIGNDDPLDYYLSIAG